MTGPAYPAAHSVAPKVHAHFMRHTAEARTRGEQRARDDPRCRNHRSADRRGVLGEPAPRGKLRPEDLAGVPGAAEAALHPLMFERPLPLEPARAGARGAGRRARRAFIWASGATTATCRSGARRARSRRCASWSRWPRPDCSSIKHHRGDEAGKFVNVAVLEGDQIKIVDEQASSLPDCPPLLTSLLGIRFARLMGRLGQRAGAAGRVDARARPGRRRCSWSPPDSDSWRESIVRPIPYAVVPAFAELAQLQRARRRTIDADGCGRTRWQPRRRGDRRADGGRRRDGADDRLRAARVRREDRAAQGVAARSSRSR